MAAADVRALRERVNASQSVFARFLNVSTRLMRAWDADRRRPDGAALRLLEIAERDPGVVFPGTTATNDHVGDAASSGRTPASNRMKASSTTTRRRCTA